MTYTPDDMSAWDAFAIDRWLAVLRTANDETYMDQINSARKHFSDLGHNNEWSGAAYNAAYDRVDQDHTQGRRLYGDIDSLLDVLTPIASNLNNYRTVLAEKVRAVTDAKLAVSEDWVVTGSASDDVIYGHQSDINIAKGELDRLIMEFCNKISEKSGDIRAAGNLIAASIDADNAPTEGDRGTYDHDNLLQHTHDARAELDRLIRLQYMGEPVDPAMMTQALNNYKKWSQLLDTQMDLTDYSVSERRFGDAQDFIFQEMKKNVNSTEVDRMSHLNNHHWWEFASPSTSDKSAALLEFYKMEHTGAQWDHKWQLQQRFDLSTKDDYYFKDPAQNRAVYYDIYSNIHYGYVGRAAGFDQSMLMWAANQGGSTGVNDAGDDITMRIGCELYDKYGKNLTEAQLHDGIEQAMREMDEAMGNGQSVTQIRVTK